MLCSVVGCHNPVFERCPKKGWCSIHYRRNYNYGDPTFTITTPRENIDVAIEEAINYTDKRHCLIWNYNRDEKGYAVAGNRGRVHRIVCNEVYGNAPTDKPHALHDNGRGYGCGRDGCINPHHLYWGNEQDNANDRIIQGTQVRGETAGNHILTEKEVIKIRKLYSAGGWTHQQLADIFGVVRQTIGDIINRRRWRHI